MDRRAEAAAAAGPDLCLSDALCRAHYRRARNLSRDGDFPAALDAYQTAYRRRAASWLLLSIGRTVHKLGRPSDALAYYNQYKDKDPHPAPELEARLNEYLKEVQDELAQAAAAAATAKQAPEPVPTKVTTAEKSDGAVPPATDSTSTTAEPAPAALPSSPPPPSVAPIAVAAPVLLKPSLSPPLGEVTPARTPSERGAPPSIVRTRSSGVTAGSVLGALGLVGLAAGLGFYEQTLADRSQFSLIGDEFDKLALRRRAQGFQVASPIGFSVGAVLLVTGVSILGYSAHKRRQNQPNRAQLALLSQDHRFLLGLAGVY